MVTIVAASRIFPESQAGTSFCKVASMYLVCAVRHVYTYVGAWATTQEKIGPYSHSSLMASMGRGHALETKHLVQ